MKTALTILLFFACYTLSIAQFVIKREVKEPIAGICNPDEVYALMPIAGQTKAVCSITETEILVKLNDEIQFLKDNPKYDDKGMIGLIINCKGELVECKMDRVTKSKELDEELETAFKNLGTWKAGKLDGKEVDSSLLFSFKIKNGNISFN